MVHVATSIWSAGISCFTCMRETYMGAYVCVCVCVQRQRMHMWTSILARARIRARSSPCLPSKNRNILFFSTLSIFVCEWYRCEYVPTAYLFFV